MDLASFLIGLLPVLAVAFVCVVAFRKRRRRGSPLIVNPYTLTVEPHSDTLGRPPVVQPMPPTSTGQKL